MANDGVCDGSDLQHLLLDADKVEAQLLAALDVLSLHPATPRRSTLRADANGPITRSCASRQREVVRIISLAHGLASVVRVFADMGVIGQKYAYESATTAGPLVQVERTLTTAAPRPGPRRSLSPGPGYPPTAPSPRGCGAPSGPLPARPAPRMTSRRHGQRGGGAAAGPAYSAGFQAPGGRITIQTVVLTVDRPGAGSGLRALSTLYALSVLSVRLVCRTSLETMARQVPAGCRTPGNLLGACSGSAHGIDLRNDHSRLVRFATQIPDGSRQPGS